MQRFTIPSVPTDIGATLAASEVIDLRSFGGGMVHILSGVGLTTLTWYSCTTSDGTFLPVQDGVGTAVTSTVAPSQACMIPAACFASAFLKAVGNVAAVADVTLKG